LAEGFAGAGQIADGLEAVDEVLARSERNEDRWCLAELLRIKGALLAKHDQANVAAVKDHFARSLDCAGASKRCPGNCEQLQASPGCGKIKIELRRRASCLHRFMGVSPKVSRP
jgi:hypothetical protein